MAGNYNCPIPRTQPLANAAARSVTYRAPAIAKNAPRRLDHLVAACRETRSMKRARKDGHTIADNEYTRALLRKQAVANELASSEYYEAGTPLWAIALRDDIRDLRDDLRRRQVVIRNISSDFERN
jgi:hypothetical protein